jgi:hypothetical protein
MSEFLVPLFVRGELIEDDAITFGGRSSFTFAGPDVAEYLDQIPLKTPAMLTDIHEVSLDEILDVLVELGTHLDIDSNAHVQAAFEAGLSAAPYPASLLRNSYVGLPHVFARSRLEAMVETSIGRQYLDGWVHSTLDDGRDMAVRAFGARTLHIPAGNGGVVSAMTIIRSALCRSDAIIKVPSNDPLTAIAIARTLADIAPDHPVTKHLAIGYWKGGDEAIEKELYQPKHIEKIVAWGGFAAMKHVTQYIQPGLELISLDPKRSATIIGPEAFESDQTMHDVAVRAACDIGTANQEGCACARVIYVLSGTSHNELARLNQLGEMIYGYLVGLPDHISTKPRSFDQALREHLDGTRIDDTFFKVIGGEDNEGAIVVSQFDEPIDYAPMLSGKTANLVPVATLDKVSDAVNAYTQTVGIYPDSLKTQVRNELPLYGAQRLVSLGYACSVTGVGPQDAIEPMRRMCKWITDETCDPTDVFPIWAGASYHQPPATND